MMGVKYNLAVKTGSYVDRSGQTKNKWQNVGVMLEGKYGPYILLNKWFNPAGIDSDGDSISVSLFEPKPRDNQGGGYEPLTDPDVVF
jgi:hypothetical protein